MPTTVKYYPINEDIARRAKEMMSFDNYVPGSATATYRSEVDKAVKIADAQKAKTDPMYHEKIDGLLDAYARKLAENMNQMYSIQTRCPSVMIAGGSNFPVKKKEKQNEASDRNMQEYQEIQKILDKIRATGKGGISSDDHLALDKLRTKLEKLEKHQALMKAANAAVRMKDQEKGNAKLRDLGYTEDEIKQLRTPDFCGRIGYPSYALSNNNANIKRVRERIAELEKRQTEAAPEGWTFEGGEVVINTELNRLQIFFDDKPADACRTELKSYGFRWAPSQGAWQRQLTDNAINAAKKITKEETA